MNTINELFNAAYSLPRIGARGGRARLSYPIVIQHEEVTFFGFMVSFYGENIPDGFVLYNSKTGETRFYDNKQIFDDFAVPVGETIHEESSEEPEKDCPDDLLAEYEQAVMQDTLCIDAYNKYLMKVMSAVVSEKRKFYKLFLIGGEE